MFTLDYYFNPSENHPKVQVVPSSLHFFLWYNYLMQFKIKNNKTFIIVVLSVIGGVLAILFIPSLNFLRPMLYIFLGIYLVMLGLITYSRAKKGEGIETFNVLPFPTFYKKKDSSIFSRINAFIVSFIWIISGLVIIFFSIKGWFE